MKTLSLFILLVAALMAAEAQAIFIDFRGLASPNTASGGGVRATMASAVLKSTATRFGVDASSSLDVLDLVDGGGGFAESFSIQFSQQVYMDSLVLSEFDPAIDAGTFNIKAGTTFTLSSGENSLGGEIASSGANILTWTGANASGGGRGFSVDGVNVRPVATFNANFDADSDVDGADFLIWQRGLGSGSAQNAGNANADTQINFLDLQVWTMQFGGAGMTSVPEAGTSALAFVAVAILLCGRCRSATG